jgi:hypothetical protein
VASTTTLTALGAANQRGYDVDYDSDGNLYVYGGGPEFSSNSITKTKIACYNTIGNLLWTFNCAMPNSNWNQDPYPTVSNFIVDKNSNKIYVGEGFNFYQGVRIIRLKSNGIYDSFISIGDTTYVECWEFQFDCNSSNIIVMGGSTKSNLTMGTIDKNTGAILKSNISGFATYQQDVVCSSLNPSGDLFVLFASSATKQVDNFIFKCNSNYTGNVWKTWTGYDVMEEGNNKKTATNVSNGFNALSSNANYLFYYDGENLKAFNPTNGNSVGNPLLVHSGREFGQGGIESDDCNNVYVGGNNGNIIVYKFDGTNFNYDRQIYLNGHSGKTVHDLKSSKKNNRLYISGQGFVAETNFSLCDSAIIGVNIVSNCLNSVIATVINTIGGSTFDYVWTNKVTMAVLKTKLNTTQTSDTFTGLAGEDYILTHYCPTKIIKG